MPPRDNFFSTQRPTILAHRGFARDVPENSLAAFQCALDAGADVLECDVRASRDGIAVIAHDETLHRVFGDDRRVAEVDYAELKEIGGRTDLSVTSVSDALRALPDAKFNIDVKSTDVISPLARAIIDAGATDRVLITSFSGSRRRRTLALLPDVATSASVEVVVPVILVCALGLPALARWLCRRTRILQIPTRVLKINVASRRMLSRLHRAGFTVQFWTINAVDEMRELVHSGADGLVTDRCDLAVESFRPR